MSNIVPFVINSNICTSADDIADYTTMMNVIAGNSGNSYITWSLLKECGCGLSVLKCREIKNIYHYDWSNVDRDIALINSECTNVFLILQDQIRVHESYGYRLPYAKLTEFLSKIKKPILIAGLGANSLAGYVPNFHLQLDEEQIRFWRFLGDSCHSIGVRGYFTAEVLHNIGVDNVRVIGCPSYYERGLNRIISKKEDIGSIRNIGISSSYCPIDSDKWNAASTLFLQDAQSFEAEIIQRIAFSKKANVSKEEKENYNNRKYMFFTDIQSWKESLKQLDFFCGTRVHGAMIALNSGVPAVVLNRDSRAREMCEYMNIPYFPDLLFCSKIDELFNKSDYTKMNVEYNNKLHLFISFLKENNVNYNPLEEQSIGIDLPIYENMRVSQISCVESLLVDTLRTVLSGRIKRVAKRIYRKQRPAY